MWQRFAIIGGLAPESTAQATGSPLDIRNAPVITGALQFEDDFLRLAIVGEGDCAGRRRRPRYSRGNGCGKGHGLIQVRGAGTRGQRGAGRAFIDNLLAQTRRARVEIRVPTINSGDAVSPDCCEGSRNCGDVAPV